jgi:bifunctional DNase/RNase
MTLDSRPSDAMAIAVRFDAKIYVNPEVFDQQGKQAPPDQPQETKPPKQEGVHL